MLPVEEGDTVRMRLYLDLDKNHGIEQKLNEDMMNGHTRYKLIGGVSDETELILRRRRKKLNTRLRGDQRLVDSSTPEIQPEIREVTVLRVTMMSNE